MKCHLLRLRGARAAGGHRKDLAVYTAQWARYDMCSPSARPLSNVVVREEKSGAHSEFSYHKHNLGHLRGRGAAPSVVLMRRLA